MIEALSLANVVPQSWIDGEVRFAPNPFRRSPKLERVRRTPTDEATLLTLASSGPLLLERGLQLGREALERLNPWLNGGPLGTSLAGVAIAVASRSAPPLRNDRLSTNATNLPKLAKRVWARAKTSPATSSSTDLWEREANSLQTRVCADREDLTQWWDCVAPPFQTTALWSELVAADLTLNHESAEPPLPGFTRPRWSDYRDPFAPLWELVTLGLAWDIQTLAPLGRETRFSFESEPLGTFSSWLTVVVPFGPPMER